MAIATANQRNAAIGLTLPFRARIPTPDSAVGSGDRVQLVYLCRSFSDYGAAVDPFVPVIVDSNWQTEVTDTNFELVISDLNWRANR